MKATDEENDNKVIPWYRAPLRSWLLFRWQINWIHQQWGQIWPCPGHLWIRIQKMCKEYNFEVPL